MAKWGWAKVRIPVLGAAIVLSGVVALLLLARPVDDGKTGSQASAAPSAQPVAASLPSPAPSAAPAPDATLPSDLSRVDASDLYPKVKQHAERWSSGARLLSIWAGPVVETKVDLSRAGGEIVYQFAAGRNATGREQPPGRLSLRVTREGIKPAAAEPNKGAMRAAAADPGEPNCVFDAAAKAARASGVPVKTPMKLRYEADGALGRGVWRAKVDGRRDLDRTIDGNTCAIVVRR